MTNVDEAFELLTGLPAGTRGDDGQFPADSVNGRVEEKLRRLAEQAHEFARGEERARS